MDLFVEKENRLGELIIKLTTKPVEDEDAGMYRYEMGKLHQEAKLLLTELDELLAEKLAAYRLLHRRKPPKPDSVLDLQQSSITQHRKKLLDALLLVKENARRLEDRQALELVRELGQTTSKTQNRHSPSDRLTINPSAPPSRLPPRLNHTDQITTARSISDSLRRSRDMLREEMERGGEMTKVFKSSSAVIQESLGNHTGLAATTSVSREYLAKLRRREITDTILLALGTTFFFVVVIYVICSRLRII